MAGAAATAAVLAGAAATASVLAGAATAYVGAAAGFFSSTLFCCSSQLRLRWPALPDCLAVMHIIYTFPLKIVSPA